jgi:hypothetical protein
LWIDDSEDDQSPKKKHHSEENSNHKDHQSPPSDQHKTPRRPKPKPAYAGTPAHQARLQREQNNREVAVQDQLTASAHNLSRYVRSWAQLKDEILTNLPHLDPAKCINADSLVGIDSIKKQWMKLFVVS